MFKYPWQDLVLQAFGAPLDILSEKIVVAQEAMTARLADPHQTDISERAELNDALIALRAFAVEKRVSPQQPIPAHVT
jgi:hypothetical protein